MEPDDFALVVSPPGAVRGVEFAAGNFLNDDVWLCGWRGRWGEIHSCPDYGDAEYDRGCDEGLSVNHTHADRVSHKECVINKPSGLGQPFLYCGIVKRMKKLGWRTWIAVVIIVGIVLAAFFSLSVWRGSAVDLDDAFAQVPCPKVARPYFDSSSYTGPLIDTHIHIAHLPDGPVLPSLARDSGHPLLGVNVSMVDYVCMMDTENTKAVFGFFPVWDPIRQESLEVVKQTLARYPGRFVPFIMPPDHDDSPDGFPTITADVLEEMVGVFPDMFVGYGEIGLYARGDHGGPKGAPELLPNAPRLKEIYPVVRNNNLIVYVHLGEGQADEFEQVLTLNPDIQFIWHGDQLIPTRGGRQDLSLIEGILSRHPNAHYGVDELYGDTWLLKPEVSKQEFLDHFNNYEPLLAQDLATWKGFIERHPNQVLWGTDRGWSAPWSLDQDVALTLNRYSRAFIGRLDVAVQEKFAYKNAEQLLTDR